MQTKLIEFSAGIAHVLGRNIGWMSWNLFLAFIPLGLSVWLFRVNRRRTWTWWLGFAVFLAFLPNAPYLLTDVIHLIDDIRRVESIWMITLVLLPVYLVVILAGFEAYVISLINWGYSLHRTGKSNWILRIELICHALCAVGIFWGRFLRFNSWDFITQPDAVLTTGIEEILGRQPLVIIGITFLILTGLYGLMKRVTLGFIKQPRDNSAINSRQYSAPK
jgi:uncharacterized membrane protein